MQKIISMLLIASMLTGCGKIKNFLHPEINENNIENNEAVAALKARLEALEAKNKVDPKINADFAALKAKNTEGWWNWRLREDGWKSWISTPTIAITAVFVVASSVYSLYKVRSLYNIVSDHINNYYNPSVDAFEEMQNKVNEHTKDIGKLKNSHGA